MAKKNVTRRHFLAAASAAFSAPYVIASTALGQDGRPAASERITMATIGCGGRGSHDMVAFLSNQDVQMVAVCDVVKNKRNAADHPCSLLGDRDITLEDVLNSEVLAWPVQRLDVSPVTDGAVALVLAAEHVARRISDRPVWIEGVGWNLDTSYWTNRDLYYPRYVENAARMAYEMAGITEPRKQIHIAEPYDPFDYKELHHLEGLLLFDRGKAPEATALGITQRDGDLPVCPSGGLLGVGNPIAAAGLMKVAELFWQLRGEAGARQVPGQPKRGVAQAWGDLMQVGTVVVMGV